MLAEIDRQSSGRVRTCVADIRTLPAPDRAFDFAFAGFVLNHLRDPAVGLAELGRVTRTGGSVVATSFGTDQHPVKAAIEAVLRAHGWEPPEWYDEIKATVMPLTATVEAFTGVGRRAGFPDGMTHAIDVDLGDLPVEVVAAYRLGMAHTVPFLAGLNGAARARLTRDAERAVTGMPPLRLPLLVFHAVKR
jgi:SAM-dependent methyltransferase